MPKRKLPHLRRFLKRMPQLALRGTTEEHLPREVFGKKKGRISAEPNFFLTRRISLKAKTREIVHKLYNSTSTAIHYAISGARIAMPTRENNWHFSGGSGSPVILLAMDSLRKMKVQEIDWNHSLADNGFPQTGIEVKGSRVANTNAFATGLSTVPFVKSNAEFIKIQISPEDFAATERALHGFMQENKAVKPKTPMEVEYFCMNFLTRHMVRKAIPFIRAAMPKKKK